MCGGVGEERRRGKAAPEGALWWAALQEVEGVGAGTMLRLARVFGSAEGAVRASREELIARGGLSGEQADQVMGLRESAGRLRGRVQVWAEAGIELVGMDDARYPGGLRDLRSAPPLLYVRGTLIPEDARAVAVVGTREPSRAGARAARRLGRGLAERGFTIVSGLARGIDTAGHRGALAAEQGRTVAVLGCGLMQIYPPESGMLAARIAERGCLMAEVPPERRVDRRLLLARDRIQAALSRAVIVVQAHGECGSIVTARHARQCGRMLFAVAWEEPRFLAGWERLRELGARTIQADANLDALAEEIQMGSPGPTQGTML
ncbi:MAG: DNA-processing protein DprA [Armatimonadota bacterium]|nr:MAG: DNA-processing protein DprA [Armatimonadota bacterium]